MAKKRKYDDEPEYEAAEQPPEELESSDPQVADSEPTEAETPEEGVDVAPTTGGPQKYRVERAGGTVRGQALEEGQFVFLTPEEAQRQAQSGTQLSWTAEDQQPDSIDNTLPNPEGSDEQQRQKRQDTDTDRGQVHRPSKP